jgi:hypothetical protein
MTEDMNPVERLILAGKEMRLARLALQSAEHRIARAENEFFIAYNAASDDERNQFHAQVNRGVHD